MKQYQYKYITLWTINHMQHCFEIDSNNSDIKFTSADWSATTILPQAAEFVHSLLCVNTALLCV